jgi:hypothetical protein
MHLLNWTLNAYAVKPTCNRTRMKWKLISSIKFLWSREYSIKDSTKLPIINVNCPVKKMESKKIITENKHFGAYFLVFTQ